MYNQLTSEQRYEIYLGIKRKWSISRISREIEVSASTVLREIRRNSNTNGEYVWRTAQRKAEARKHGLEGNHRKPAELWWRIEQMIEEEDWSPSQIAGVLRKEGIHIAIQTIYNHVHADASGRLAKHMPHELEVYQESQGDTPHQGHKHSQSHKHPRPSQGGGRHTLRRLGDGYHRGFLRPRHCHAYGMFNQLHSDGETEVRTQGCAYGESRG
ncbi:helix-turn-helix domain-containing protein [Bacteroides thetaiotaomicron]|nr:helix-turn-helix domain-containing protein [Bacteroides thetaiotaomicron]